MRLKEDTAGVGVKDAVHLAKAFAADLLEAEKISRLGLEAVERSADGKFWLVTLGFTRPWRHQKLRRTGTALDQVLPLRGAEPEREYKVFQVDAESGEVVAMKVFDE